MKLCAIYNVWDDWDLLFRSLNNIRPLVDGVIVIASEYSNCGEKSKIPICWFDNSPDVIVDFECFQFEPNGVNSMQKETSKRNFGLNKARELGYTHFLMMDADEFYHPDQFLKAKERFHVERNLAGLIVPCNVYFKSPTLTIGRDITRVPFIHKLTPTIRHEFNRAYPFAWEGLQIRIDPTRSLNINSGVEYTEDVVMEHYSWVRSDYEKKIRNSTAKNNLDRSTIRQDLIIAKDGEFCKFYGKVLYTVPNYFNLPEYDVMVQDL